MNLSKKNLLVILSFLAIYVVWGSTYLFNKIAVSQLSPFYLASIRFFVAGFLMVFLAIITKQNLIVTKKQFLNSLIASFFFIVYGNGVYVWALKYVDSGFGALIASTQPLFVLVLLRFIDKKQFKKKSIIGIFLGILGMVLLVVQEELATSNDTFIGILMMLSCVLSWSYGSIFVSKADLPKSFIVTTGYQMIFASIALIIISFSLNEVLLLPNYWDYEVSLSMLFLIVFGGIIAFTAFNFLLKNVSTEKVSTSAYVNPVIALLLGYFVLNETLTIQSMIASIILLCGVYFIISIK